MSELFKVYTANVSGVCEKPKYDPEFNNFFYKSIKLKFDSNFYDNNQVVLQGLHIIIKFKKLFKEIMK